MSDSSQDPLKTKATRIRAIVQTAATQIITELKQGTREIGSIASQSSSTAPQTSEQLEPANETRIANPVRSLLANLDVKLANQHGNRYSTVKQRLEQFRTWYNKSKANSATIGVAPVQQKQAEIELKLADQGAVVARKEQQIRQQIKQLFTAVVRATRNTTDQQ